LLSVSNTSKRAGGDENDFEFKTAMLCRQTH